MVVLLKLHVDPTKATYLALDRNTIQCTCTVTRAPVSYRDLSLYHHEVQIWLNVQSINFNAL